MKSKNKYFWGLFFILAGCLVILNQLNIFVGINLVSLVFAIFLVAILIKSIAGKSVFGTLFSIAFLLIVFDEQLGITKITPWPILAAALLGTIGFSLIFGDVHVCHVGNTKRTIKSGDEVNDNVVDINVSFGDVSKYVTTKTLEKINVSCSFGGVELYLDKAEFKNDKAELELNISFAGVEIYLPRNCRIVNNADVSLGGVDEKNNSSSDKDMTLTITGKVSLAGVEIIYI